jgi:hypothetical protein
MITSFNLILFNRPLAKKIHYFGKIIKNSYHIYNIPVNANVIHLNGLYINRMFEINFNGSSKLRPMIYQVTINYN